MNIKGYTVVSTAIAYILQYHMKSSSGKFLYSRIYQVSLFGPIFSFRLHVFSTVTGTSRKCILFPSRISFGSIFSIVVLVLVLATCIVCASC